MIKNIRQTSIDCYNQIKSEGLLSQRRMEVFEAIYNNAPCTGNEIFKMLKLPTNQSGRFTELRELGVIKEVGTKECSITHRNVILWDLTDSIPAPKIKKVLDNPKPKNLKKAIAFILKDMINSQTLFADETYLKSLL